MLNNIKVLMIKIQNRLALRTLDFEFGQGLEISIYNLPVSFPGRKYLRHEL